MSAFIREEEEVRLGNKERARLINASSRAATIFTQSGVGISHHTHTKHDELWK
jgi:hypothetical protein